MLSLAVLMNNFNVSWGGEKECACLCPYAYVCVCVLCVLACVVCCVVCVCVRERRGEGLFACLLANGESGCVGVGVLLIRL